MKTLEELSSGRRKEYFPPYTSHVTVGLEGCGLLANSKDPVVNTNTEITIDRQGDSGLGSKFDAGNIVNDQTFSFTWE